MFEMAASSKRILVPLLFYSYLYLSWACQDCIVDYWDDGDYISLTIPAEGDFAYGQNCRRYDCHCNCDGSYNCTGVYDCPCQTCSLDPSKQPGEWFEMTKGCNKETCRCSCEGGYTCRSVVKIC